MFYDKRLEKDLSLDFGDWCRIVAAVGAGVVLIGVGLKLLGVL